ncbi:hypothetical protein [Aquimarina sediminis]|uniref:hypothetical protein n=1 Tax=Aquimarina sediminis TaxID=2070536 RepID=UPI000CA032E2|nr:hypothetical protein [Aquimarina sediminis]
MVKTSSKLNTLIRVLFVLGVFILLQSCIVSRFSRPKLTGYVFDLENMQPISGCKVGETLTDSTGYYELKEKRYKEIVLIAMEAPPLSVREIVKKEGYVADTIKAFNRYGGSGKKGKHWKMDTIYLKRKN